MSASPGARPPRRRRRGRSGRGGPCAAAQARCAGVAAADVAADAFRTRFRGRASTASPVRARAARRAAGRSTGRGRAPARGHAPGCRPDRTPRRPAPARRRGMPVPVSCTRSSQWSRSASMAQLDRSRLAVYLIALSMRLRKTRSSSIGSLWAFASAGAVSESRRPLRRAAGVELVAQAAHELNHRKLGRADRDDAGVELRHVEQGIELRAERLQRGVDVAGDVPARAVQRAHHQRGSEERQRVHRLAKIVACRGEEPGLRTIGVLGNVERLAKPLARVVRIEESTERVPRQQQQERRRSRRTRPGRPRRRRLRRSRPSRGRRAPRPPPSVPWSARDRRRRHACSRGRKRSPSCTGRSR